MSSQIPATVNPPGSSPITTSTPATSTTTSTSSSSSSIPTSTTATTSSAPSSDSTTSSSSSSSSATSSITAASSTTSSTTSSRSRETSSSSDSFIVESSDGQVYTRTSIVTVPGSTPTQTSSDTRSPTSFIHNKGAVAGVFSVVGVIGLVALFFLFTSYIRRRRARELDREIDEAAAAAAAAAARAPDFDDIDYTSGTGTGYGHYSETSHGTFNQPPLSHETNNFGDIPTSYEPYGMAGQAPGAAGIGARGRSVRGGGAQDPYGALANPPEQYEMYERRQSWTQGIPRGGPGVTPYDLIQAAGMSDGDPYAVARATSQRLNHSQSKSGMSGPTRSQSQGTSILPPTTENYPMPTPAPGYPGGLDTPYPAENARYSASYAPGGGVSTMPPDVNEEAYSGYQDQPSASLDNPHSPGFAGPGAQYEEQEVVEDEDIPNPHRNEDSARASLADDEDYGYNSGHRVLRIANE